MAAVVNLTPHEVVILDKAGAALVRLPSRRYARRATTTSPGEPASTPDGAVPIVDIEFGEVTGLPEPQPGVRYLVSWLTYHALPQRDDLLVPAEEVRGPGGAIVGCRALGRMRDRRP